MSKDAEMILKVLYHIVVIGITLAFIYHGVLVFYWLAVFCWCVVHATVDIAGEFIGNKSI